MFYRLGPAFAASTSFEPKQIHEVTDVVLTESVADY
jgi:hypothetical protein